MVGVRECPTDILVPPTGEGTEARGMGSCAVIGTGQFAAIQVETDVRHGFRAT
jgi:hypothetical protein